MLRTQLAIALKADDAKSLDAVCKSAEQLPIPSVQVVCTLIKLESARSSSDSAAVAQVLDQAYAAVTSEMDEYKSGKAPKPLETKETKTAKGQNSKGQKSAGSAPAARTYDQDKAYHYCMALVAQIGRLAVKHNLVPLASQCHKICQLSRKYGLHRAWILCELSTVELKLKENVTSSEGEEPFGYGPSRQTLMQLEIQKRRECAESLLSTVTSAIRLGDRTIIEDACSLAWSVCNPHLLTSETRSLAHVLLQRCCEALESVNSATFLLRAQFHLETARADAAEDYLQKAKEHVTKALGLDYTLQLTQLTSDVR